MKKAQLIHDGSKPGVTVKARLSVHRAVSNSWFVVRLQSDSAELVFKLDDQMLASIVKGESRFVEISCYNDIRVARKTMTVPLVDVPANIRSTCRQMLDSGKCIWEIPKLRSFLEAWAARQGMLKAQAFAHKKPSGWTFSLYEIT